MDEKTKAVLQKLADGYDYEEKIIIADKSGKPQKVQLRKKHMSPSIEAIKMIESLKHENKW